MGPCSGIHASRAPKRFYRCSPGQPAIWVSKVWKRYLSLVCLAQHRKRPGRRVGTDRKTLAIVGNCGSRCRFAHSPCLEQASTITRSFDPKSIIWTVGHHGGRRFVAQGSSSPKPVTLKKETVQRRIGWLPLFAPSVNGGLKMSSVAPL